ncbi:MAG: RND family transporter [Candidatus Marinimicrobia bacterium]|nr:RND family transporter [Candidatus Neomarinimicrobiota bacterium]
MKSWIDFVLKYPKTIIAFCILITVLMGWNIPKLEIEPDLKAMFPTDFDIIISMNKMEDIFGGSDLIVMSVSSDDIFNENTLKKIDDITSEIEEIEMVDRVISLTNAVDIKATEDGFEVGELFNDYPETAKEVKAIKERIIDNNMLYGNIVSKDFKKAAIVSILELTNGGNDDDEVSFLFNKIAKRYEGPEQIHIAGMPLTRHEITNTMQSDMKMLFPFGIVLMIFLLVFCFRSWIGAFLPFIVVIMSIINMIGLMALLGIKFTFIGVMMPVMLIAIANDYSIHIVAHYFEEYKKNSDRTKNLIIKSTLQHLQTPVFLAGITTLIGFLSLQSHILPPARQLGLLVSFGIAIAFILSLTFVPAALKLLDYPVFLAAGNSSEKMNRFLSRWGNLFTRHKLSFLLIVALIILVISTGITKINVDTNPIYYFRKSSEIRRANEVIDKEFGGSSQLEILAKGDIKSPEFLKKIEWLTDFLDKKDNITQTSSIVDQLKLMNKAFHGDSAEYKVIPKTREEVAQYLFLYSLTGNPEDMDHFVDYDYEQAQILARVNETGSVASFKLYNEAKVFIENELGEENFPSITGVTAFIGVLSDLVIKGQIRSLILSIFFVCLVSAIIFKSIVGGLLSIVPLSGAILMVFGLMGYIHIDLNMATVMLSSIMIGVGIDYTIHFLYRYRLEVKKGASAEEAVTLTLTTSGKGIIYNALSVIVGFSVLTISGFLPIYFFGFLVVFSITGCLLGALSVMPALLVLVKPAFIFGKKRNSNDR